MTHRQMVEKSISFLRALQAEVDAHGDRDLGEEFREWWNDCQDRGLVPPSEKMLRLMTCSVAVGLSHPAALIPYYEKFLEHPDVDDDIPLDDLL